MAMTLGELAERIDARLVGERGVRVVGCAPIDRAGPDQVTFIANARYARYLDDTRAAAVIVADGTACPEGVAHLVAEDPYFAFRNAVIALHGFRSHPDPPDAADGVSRLATVHPEAVVGPGTRIHPHATVDIGARIGRDCVLYPGVYVGPHARVGDECLLYPNVVVYDHCELGDRVTLHANTVVGHDGFGYATYRGEHHKIPQSGNAVLEDDVELGAGCAVERATIGETRIGRGTKFADLISIGHGTRVGRHCIFVSLVGVSGSVDVGDYVVLGGQAGITGHLKIGDGVQAQAQSGITSDIPPGTRVGGAPAVEIEQARRNLIIGRNLGELVQRVKAIERKLEMRKPRRGGDRKPPAG